MECGIFHTTYQADNAFRHTVLSKARLWLLIAFLLTFPLYADAYYLDTAIRIGYGIVAAVGLNILVGYAGQISIGLGAFLGALNVKYRDVKYAIPFGIQLLLFLTPIIYPLSVFPERFRWLLAINPLTGLIEAFRYALVPTYSVQWEIVALSLTTTSVILVLAVGYFKRTERAFADIV